MFLDIAKPAPRNAALFLKVQFTIDINDPSLEDVIIYITSPPPLPVPCK